MTAEIWTISEQKGNELRDISFELLAWGRKLADIRSTSLCAIVFADQIPTAELAQTDPTWR